MSRRRWAAATLIRPGDLLHSRPDGQRADPPHHVDTVETVHGMVQIEADDGEWAFGWPASDRVDIERGAA